MAVLWPESTSSRLIDPDFTRATGTVRLGAIIPVRSRTVARTHVHFESCSPRRAVSSLLRPRLELHAIDVAEAERIVARRPGPADSWAADYPFEGDLAAVGAFLRASATAGEQRPFGYYRITRVLDRTAVGGIGFKGPPARGCAEIGYGLTPSAHGHGYASEAVRILLTVAAQHGLSRLVATTTMDNIASQVTLSPSRLSPWSHRR